MKTKSIVIVLALAGIVAMPRAYGTNTVITSFSGNGTLTWTAGLTNAAYTVQWAPSLSAPTWTDSWGQLVGVLPTGTTCTAAVPMFYRIVAQQPRLYHFADWYYSCDPNVFRRQVFAVTNFTDSSSRMITNAISGFRSVPYKSGTIVGVTDLAGDVFYNDGNTAMLLGADGWFVSTDTNLTAHPSSWSFPDVSDGMIITGNSYDVTEDLSQWQADSIMLLIQVQTVTVPAGVFSNAVIFWYLDTNYPFANLNFHGVQAEMGITLPTSAQTHGYSVTDFNIYGYKAGQIAAGDIDARSGTLTNGLYRLKTILPP